MTRFARHPLAWFIWLGAAFTAAMTTRNPLYLVVLLMALLVVYQAVAAHAPNGPAWSTFIRFGLSLSLIGVAMNALMAHVGDTVLFSLPSTWPIVGGHVTLEAIVQGLIGVLQLACLLVAGAVLGLTLDSAAFLRVTPAGFYHAGLVLTIGLAFIPQTVAGFQEIREAQRVRGHRFRAPRDLLPLIGPLLTTGLERAVQLAESLEARGFGYVEDERDRAWVAQLGLLVGGLLIGGALFSLGYWGRQPLILAAIVAGAAILTYTLARLMPRTRRTRYRRLRWARNDVLVGGAAMALLAMLAAILTYAPALLYYTPFPRLSWPPFSPWVGVIYLLLLAPLAPPLPAPLSLSEKVGVRVLEPGDGYKTLTQPLPEGEETEMPCAEPFWERTTAESQSRPDALRERP
ncbi:MAG: energy-coupling factor transporter transmembrane component T [Anaerolineae bacterium]